MKIRPESQEDRAGIFRIHASSFPTDAEARLVDLLRDASRLAVSLVAEEGGELVAHVAFSPVTAGNAKPGAGLAPVAVLESHRRRGVADNLIRAGLALCRREYGWSVVLGEPKYYSRFGYRPAREFGLKDEYGGGDAFQALALNPGGIPKNAGLVKYAPEFASVA